MVRFSLRDKSDSPTPSSLVPLKRSEAGASAPSVVPASPSQPTYSVEAPVPSTPAVTNASTKIHAEDLKPPYKIDETVFYAYIVPREGSRSLDVIVLTHPDEKFVPVKVHASFTRDSYERVFELPPSDCKQDPRLEPYVSGNVKLPKGGRLRRYSPPFLDWEVPGWKNSPRYEPRASHS